MNGYSVRDQRHPEKEITSMNEEQVSVARDGFLPEGMREGLRWEYQQVRDERLFHAAWFADFKERWQDDLYRERLNFQARMAAI
jgi:hypothetical protein